MEQFTMREYEILNYLLQSKGPVSTQEIADRIGLSQRAVQYDLKKIEFLLRQKGITLVRKRYAGVWIENRADAVKVLNLDFLSQDEVIWQVLSQPERVRKIVSLLLRSDSAWTIEDLGHEMEVSRSTVINDLKDVETWFRRHGIVLVRKTRIGLSLRYEERVLRQATLEFIQENLPGQQLLKELLCRTAYEGQGSRQEIFIRNFILSILRDQDLFFFQTCIHQVEKQLHVTYSDSGVFYLVLYFGILKDRVQRGYLLEFPPMQMERVRDTGEFQSLSALLPLLEDQLSFAIPESELGWLAAAFQRIPRARTHDGVVNTDRYTKEEIQAVHRLAAAEARQLNLDQEQISELELDLLGTLHPMLFWSANRTITNPDLEDIQEQYPYVFQTVRNNIAELEHLLKIRLKEHEIGLLATCVCAYVEKKARRGDRNTARILVVCGAGIGTSRLLVSRLENEFPNLTIADAVTVRDVENYNLTGIDFVVTTVPVRNLLICPVVLVSPLLKSWDVEQIARLLKAGAPGEERRPGANLSINRVIDIISQTCTIHDRSMLRQALELEYGRRDDKFEHQEEERMKMISDMIALSRIRVKVPAHNKKEVIQTAGQLLFQDGCVDERYIDAMQEMAETFNSYIVIMPGVAMPHARPEAGAKKAAFAVMTLACPVVFGHPENDPVQFVVALSAPDKSSHLLAVRQLSKLLCDEEAMQGIFNAETPQEIYDIMVAFEKKLNL